MNFTEKNKGRRCFEESGVHLIEPMRFDSVIRGATSTACPFSAKRLSRSPPAAQSGTPTAGKTLAAQGSDIHAAAGREEPRPAAEV